MSISKVSFGTTTIQKMRRVALDGNLLETLKLREGDSVSVELDVASAAIIIRRAPARQVPSSKRARRGANA